MSNDNHTKDYNWIILFFLFISAIARLMMQVYKFVYTDYFITMINLIALDYTVTNIINGIHHGIEKIIDDNKTFVLQAKNNKKKKHTRYVRICIALLVVYNIIHLILFSCSTGNDMLSMIVLGITLTDETIIDFLKEHIKV